MDPKETAAQATTKLYVSMRYWLLGAGMHQALNALEYAATFHINYRKDNVTPEYKHQLSIAHYIRTFFNHLSFPEQTLTVAFLHDVCEDYDVGFEEIEAKFGSEVRRAVDLVTKKHRGDKTPLELYYKEIAKNPIASVVKGADRVNNIQTMVGVFSLERQKEYLDETENLVLPMLKTARRQFTIQESAYENMKFVLRSQIELIQAIHKVDNGNH